MSTKDFTANVISATKVVPDGKFKDSKASGIWDINEALDLIKGGNWPNVANVNPAAFVDALFQAHAYSGNGGTQTITNGINLSGSGGLVWGKDRDTGTAPNLTDTINGGTKTLFSHNTSVHQDRGDDFITSFNSNGYSIGADGLINDGDYTYVSWTFRQQPKFFDIVTYSGTGSARTVAHSLNTTVGMIIIKNLDQADNWAVYHRANTAAPQTDYLILNSANGTADSAAWWNDTAPTSSVFTVGTDHSVNASGENYVAYLFAHNNDDGGFGEPGDQDIIKCGSYTGNGSSDGPTIDLGFEPQLVLIRKSSGSNWFMIDSTTSANTLGLAQSYYLLDSAAAEQTYSPAFVGFNSTGFKIGYTASNLNVNNEDDIYMAIRRGGMQTPTAASDVFAVDFDDGATAPAYVSGFVTDMGIQTNTAGYNKRISTRLTSGKYLEIDNTGAEQASTSNYTWDFMNGWNNQSVGTTWFSWMWKRARGYFDVVAYTGTGSNTTVAHNLGVAPEMMWVKKRNSDTNGSWLVYHSGTGNGKYLVLNTNAATVTQSTPWNDTDPTSTVFSLGTKQSVNNSDDTYAAYLFATLAGVSKVGSFTQSGATNVACGFTGDTPSFILLKRTDSTGDWLVFDSVRGIVAGNDKSLALNNTDAQVTNADIVDPYSGGFATTSSLTNGDYIFYAIAATS